MQVPANADMPSHAVARHVAEREPYLSLFGPEGPPIDPVQAYVLRPEEYAQILYDLGFERQHVRLQVYPHVLPSTRHVVEWVRGTTLTRFEKRLDPEAFEAFVADYEAELLRGARRPRAALLPLPPNPDVGPPSVLTGCFRYQRLAPHAPLRGVRLRSALRLRRSGSRTLR